MGNQIASQAEVAGASLRARAHSADTRPHTQEADPSARPARRRLRKPGSAASSNEPVKDLLTPRDFAPEPYRRTRGTGGAAGAPPPSAQGVFNGDTSRSSSTDSQYRSLRNSSRGA